MPAQPPSDRGDDLAALPIGEVARRTGVAVATLRAWERRHGLLDPQRTGGGHRRYGTADLARVHRMRQLLAEGWGADAAARQAREDADAVPHGADEPAGDAEQDQDAGVAVLEMPRGLGPPAAALARRLVTAVAEFDPAGANEAIDDTFARFDVAAALDHVLMPTLRVLGEGWEHDPAVIAHEHFAVHALRPRLLRLLRVRHGGDGPRAVAAAPAGEEHDVGVLAGAAVAADDGWRVTFLGARTPLVSLRRAVEATGATVALVGAVCRPTAQGFLDDLDGPLPCALVLGGAGFVDDDVERVLRTHEGVAAGDRDTRSAMRHVGTWADLPGVLADVSG